MNDAVTVAYLHHNTAPHSWHQSMVDLLGYDLANSGRVLRGGYLALRCGSGSLVEGRNQAVEKFLAEYESDWLFWIDDDMGFPGNIVDQLIEVAHPVDRPIVGALAFAQWESGSDGMGGYKVQPRPTIFDWTSEGDQRGYMGRQWYPVNALTRCGGTGSSCVLIHRSVFEKIKKDWYTRLFNPTMNKLMGEDLSFCMRAAAEGFPVHVHTGIRTTHFKSQWVGEDEYWARMVAPPATEPTAVLVPVLNRPKNAEPFMRTLRASTGLATVYAIADPEDISTINAWRAVGAEVILTTITGRPGTFAEKINIGYRFTGEPWLFITGDDVEFRPGWLDHAQATAQGRYLVIGTNDLGNSRVMAGEHSTHILIDREYVTQVGASWDGPELVAHEGYRHWFVDDEIVTAAKLRGIWAMALGSKVVHKHPLYQRADIDDTYVLGMASSDEDRALFEKRSSQYAD